MIDKFMIFLPIVQGDLDTIEQLACRFVKQQAEHTGAMRDLKRSVDEIKGLLGQLVDARQPEA